jgi:hypothetical protein
MINTVDIRKLGNSEVFKLLEKAIIENDLEFIKNTLRPRIPQLRDCGRVTEKWLDNLELTSKNTKTCVYVRQILRMCFTGFTMSNDFKTFSCHFFHKSTEHHTITSAELVNYGGESNVLECKSDNATLIIFSDSVEYRVVIKELYKGMPYHSVDTLKGMVNVPIVRLFTHKFA